MARVALVTGGTRGIGAAISLALKAAGYKVAANYAGNDAAAQAFTAAHGIPAYKWSVADYDACAAGIARVEGDIGPVEVLVNNAGLEVPLAVVDQTPEDIERTLAVNLHAPLHLTRAVLPGMIARGRGVVVMVSSMSGKSPTPWNAVYTASKHGLNGFTASLRLELEGTGVRAGVVCPSFVAEAGMWASTGVKAPPLLKEVSPAAVAAGVRAVLDGRGEVLVTPSPVRPMLALAQLVPSLDGRLLKLLGVWEVLRARARATAEGRGPARH